MWAHTQSWCRVMLHSLRKFIPWEQQAILRITFILNPKQLLHLDHIVNRLYLMKMMIKSMILHAEIREKGLWHLLVMTLLFILWMTCQKHFQRLMHLLMESIGKMQSVTSKMDFIMFNGTWEISDCSSGCKPVGCKWIFKKKMRPDGTIEKYKARLVDKGYT